MKSGPRLPQLEKALTQKWRPNTVKNKFKKKKKSGALKKKKEKMKKIMAKALIWLKSVNWWFLSF